MRWPMGLPSRVFSLMVSLLLLAGHVLISTARTLSGLATRLLTLPIASNRTARVSSTTYVTSGFPTRVRTGGVCAPLVRLVIAALLVTTPSVATTASSDVAAAAGGGVPVGGYDSILAPYFSALRIVQGSNACALPGVSIKYDTFIPAM